MIRASSHHMRRAATAWTRSGAMIFTTSFTFSSPARLAAITPITPVASGKLPVCWKRHFYMQANTVRSGAAGTAPPDGIPNDRFVVCIQNHDQVGNRAKGDRLSTLVDPPAKLRLAASLMLLAPRIPMLFMGEEYGETCPFPFFCSFLGAELVEAVRQGRKREFAEFVGSEDEVPDPQAEATFTSAKLSWSWPDGTPHAALRRLYRDLLASRRKWPALRDLSSRRAQLVPNRETGPVLELIRGGNVDSSNTLRACFNFSRDPQPLPESVGSARAIFSSELTRYCGERRELGRLRELKPFECIVFGPNNYELPT